MFWELFLFVIFTSGYSAGVVNNNEQFEQPIQRLLGIPDTTAHVGYLFHYHIPNDAFDGNIGRYKAYNENGGPLSEWLSFDEKFGILEGLPCAQDIGEHYVSIKAFDLILRDSVKDVFAIEVLSTPPDGFLLKNDCHLIDEQTVLSIILDLKLSKIKAKERVELIKCFASFFNISTEMIRLKPMEEKDEPLFNSYITAGPGNIKRKSSHESTILQWRVGCKGELWEKYANLIDKIRKITKDGTLSKVILQPVVGWTLGTDTIGIRKRREINGPLNLQTLGDDGTDEGIPEQRIVIPNTVTPAFSIDPSIEILTTDRTMHHHRHHHGDTLPPISWPSAPFVSILPTPTYIPERPNIDKSDILISEDLLPTLSVPSPEPSSLVYTKENVITDFEKWNSPYEETESIEEPTPPLTNLTSTVTEDSVISVANLPPTILHRLQKVAVTAGKILRYRIPENTFMDPEDGNTRDLKIELFSTDGKKLNDSSWIQLDETVQEIYALPLENHVSKWDFTIIATDVGGLSVKEGLDLSVQQHKGIRTVNHAFTVELDSVPNGPSLNWQIALTEYIAKLYNDRDTSKITVLEIGQNYPYLFKWTNDSLSRADCPRKDIENLYKIASGGNGLKGLVTPGLVVKDVKWIPSGQCEEITKHSYVPPKYTNYPPVPRNQVDKLNATVGQLLIFSVPEDSFYDPEDGSTRNMKLSLITMERQRVPPNHWLRFDNKNQEFYGIPMPVNVGETEYQLVCEDSGGLTAVDGLVVIVHPASRVMYNVEFSIRLAMDYNQFVENPPVQRSFVERLATLFGDSNTHAIVLSGVAPGSTVITWHNKTLPIDKCPDTEIIALRQVLLGDDERISPTVVQAFGSQFPVIGARLTPTGVCLGALTEIASIGDTNADIDGIGRHEVTAVSHGDQYLLGLVVPAVIIAVMLVCAGLVACILYRRRTTGKLSVRDDDDRQTFRSKGIPVIFQDELDERPEPTNKSPVIMKEEKPPAPPPEYQRGVPTTASGLLSSGQVGSGGGIGNPPLATTALLSDTEDSIPYQPPPPFTTSRDSGRPKPTPTYRMPPPYVPP